MNLIMDKKSRKEIPITSGVIDYFPLALAEVAKVSYVGNKQHNGDSPLHWDRNKSNDHADCAARHLIERGTIDDDGLRHTAKLAWRTLALLQEEMEAYEEVSRSSAIQLEKINSTNEYNPSLQKQVYVSGPMRGIENHNFPAFDAARDKLLNMGFLVISPADLDRDDYDSARPVDFYVQRDMEALLNIKRSGSKPAIYMLKGWEKSFGARAEKAVAEWLEFEIIYQE